MRWFLILSCLLTTITCGALAGTPDEDRAPVQLKRPIQTSLRVEGRSTPLRGEITAWTYGAFWVLRQGGSAPMRIGWDEIPPIRVYEIARRLVDRKDADANLRLGIEMLRLDEIKAARRAFRIAEKVDPELGATVTRAIDLSLEGKDPALALTQGDPEPKATGVADDDPDLQPASPADETKAKRGLTPWVLPGPKEREEKIERQRRFAMTAGYERGDNRRRLFETDHFIMATDLDEKSMKRWGGQLEIMYATMLDTLSLPPETEMYSGKCMVFVFGSRDAYLTFERRAMGYDASRTGGLCHYRGENVIMAFYQRGSDADFQSVLIHESVHGLMYRYRSPASLPTWANEGLSDYIAGRLTPDSNEPRENWNKAKNYVLRRLDPMEIMRQSYRDGTWYNEFSYPVSHMLVRFLIRYKAPEFKLWIDDIKAGVGWETAMQDRFGVDAQTLARGFADEIRSEKTYTRER